ncbi:beta-N-acetylhexosaminidase [Microbacterium fluvii]|uniref:beta-N-acetylhexosaminidase n=1 Tax=Microbacterium fluvii TaxID=415215 RepID=A0ABW2HD85_9MICO|nr:beta-N-acetylhexosaminidase [Microbacterium fluvii]MCU4671341.1 beta-N-acetylhexosaminidase [Microbacterium fluvii]
MPDLPLVPAPAAVTVVDAAPFRLDAATAVTGDAEAAALLRALLAERAGSPLLLDAAGGVASAVDLALAAGGAPESYRLTADAAGVRIEGADAAGLFYGVHTLVQLLVADDEGWLVPAVEIADAPRFTYRGVMLDVARHFHPVATVKAYIDRAAALKFNHLHLHLSDDQGWRLRIDSRPLLTEQGSRTAIGGEPGGFYTHDDYREIVAHAAANHMTVVPEIDMPGHTHAVTLAYPELSEEPVVTDEMREILRVYGGDEPVNGAPFQGLAVGFSSLRIHDEVTYAFLADVLGEVAALTPGPYLHVGGDEALGTPADDFAHFMARATAIVEGLGKTPITWHEAGAAAGLSPGTVGQYWGFRTPIDGMDDKTRAFVARGGQVILSPADAIYLDMKYAADAPLGLQWAGIVPARQAYEWDPASVVDGVSDAEILGVEAPLWAETLSTLADIDAMAFPRIGAAAEAAWSPPLGATSQRTWESFRERVGGLAALWTSRGIGFTRLPEIDWRG